MSQSESRRRRVAAIVASFVSVLVIAFASGHWASVATPVALVPVDDPVVRRNAEITEQFGLRTPVVWVIEARQGTIWTREVLLRIQRLTREVFKIPGVVAPDVVSLASPNVRDSQISGDSLQPTYLMGSVPATAADIQRLRTRVEGDDNFNGTLVSLDGRAAMVVADFRAETDRHALAANALALRDRYTDELTRAHVAGAPILATTALREAPFAAGAVALVLSVGLIALGFTAGGRAVIAATLATGLAAMWTTGTLIGLDAIVLPWTAYAMLPTLLLAAWFVLASAPSRWTVAGALLAGFVSMSATAGKPADAFGLACSVGVVAAVLAAETSRALIRNPPSHRPAPYRHAMRPVALLLIVAAGLGLLRLQTSFSLFGHGVRYLPAGASEDLRAIEKSFPPPTVLTVRVRGEPGFVKAPEVLEAFDNATAAVRDDGAVVRAMSLADLVKMVHRAFNEGKEEFQVIPRDPQMVGRYLALGYSPGFRRFVDRAFTRAAIWVYLESDDVEDLARVTTALREQLVVHPVPDAHVDPVAGDGVIVLGTAKVARRLAWSTLWAFAICSSVIAFLGGPITALRSLAGGALSCAVLGGLLGWAGIPIDLVSLPFLVSVVFMGATLQAVADANPARYALAAMGGVAVGLAIATSNLLAMVFGAFLLAPLAPQALLRRSGGSLLARPIRRDGLRSVPPPSRSQEM